jgi:MarR family transcriptional regulator for hemolysin
MQHPTRPQTTPIGLQLSRTARLVARAFDEALVAAGGSLPMWLVLLNVKLRRVTKQRDLAAAVGIGEATLTHHLNAFERDGLLVRSRDPENRRIQIVELTADGDQRFLALRDAAITFDARLRAGLAPEQLSSFAATLDQLAANVVSSGAAPSPPWVGLLE